VNPKPAQPASAVNQSMSSPLTPNGYWM